MTGLTDQDARALTYLAKRLRAEVHGANAWDEAGIYAKVSQLRGHNLAVAIERVCRHAGDPEAKTPGAILRPFVPDAPTPGQRRAAKAGEDCRIHPGEWADSCRSCAADRLVGDTEPRATRPADPDGHVTRLRDLAHAATATTCKCGPNCRDHRTADPKGTP